MNRSRALELLSRFSEQDVLVVGDVILDKFVSGDVSRFSPEAPACPVLEHREQLLMLGGAGNVAANLNALGARSVSLIGVVGKDTESHDLSSLSREQGLDTHLFRIPSRPTTVKTRFVSQNVHLLRYDCETTDPVDDHDGRCLRAALRHQVPFNHGVVLQDYAKGVVTPALVETLMDIARREEVPVFIDPKKDHWSLFRGAELVKPNQLEALSAFAASKDALDVEQCGRSMLNYTQAKAVVVTRGAEGMHLFSEENELLMRPSPVEVVDVSGAGDTSMAALTLSRLAGASWQEALEIANAAAGIVVGKRGTSIVEADEVLDSLPETEEA